MNIILPGNPSRRKKFDFSEIIMVLMFAFLPIALIMVSIVMLVIHFQRLDSNIIVAAFQLIGDMLTTRVGYFFANGATFASVYRSNPLEYTLRLLSAAIVLLMGSLMINTKCPYCGHFFTLLRISNDRYEKSSEREVSNNYYEYSDAFTISSSGRTYYTGIATKQKQYGTEVTDHYTYNVRCSCCGCVARKGKSKTYTNWN